MKKIPMANITTTEGIIAISLNVAYGIMSRGPKMSKLAETPLRIITIILSPNSPVFLF